MDKIFFGDCRDTMKSLISDGVKVQMCVTSPPYYGLRDYGHSEQLGKEATPDEYIANLVDVFSMVHELLSDDGVLWLNLGDSYCGYKGDKIENTKGNLTSRIPASNGKRIDIATPQTSGAKNKDLFGMPWRVALALQADGWYLRQDIIWHKPNPMPESVTDRCTKSHEYMFLLSKNPRYYFDNEAIKEPAVSVGRIPGKSKRYIQHSAGGHNKDGLDDNAKKPVKETRNRRSVWTIPVKPYKGAHFAVFPPALIEPCILAGSKEGDIILDPFGGSGTTAQVAKENNRKYILCELNNEYSDLQQARLTV